MCVTLQTRVCNDLFGRSLRDATLSRPVNALINTFGVEGQIASLQVLCTESLRVMVQYCHFPWCCRGFDTPQVIDSYYWRPTHSQMKKL